MALMVLWSTKLIGLVLLEMFYGTTEKWARTNRNQGEYILFFDCIYFFSWNQLSIVPIRQPYAGLTLNAAVDVEVSDNYVKTEFNDDYAYMMLSGSTLNANSGNNKVPILFR